MAGTSDEKAEADNRRRPKRGEDWWGRGPAIAIFRKAERRAVVTGEGLPDPGRWPVNRRRLQANVIFIILLSTWPTTRSKSISYA